MVGTCWRPVLRPAHYTDLTGENHFVRDMQAQWNDRAKETGAIIVPCCGFEAIPTDLGGRLLSTAYPTAPNVW